jgi:hypothetical protein
MKMLFLAVFLTVMQATPPVPRKATDKPAGGSHGIKKDTGDKQAPAAPPLIPNKVAAEKHQNASNPPPKTNEPESIVIRELPPVTIATDWWNKFYVVLTGLLVAIGFVGVLAAFKTLRKIEEQTTNTKLAAEAAKASADALINIERARMHPEVMVEPRNLLEMARENCPNTVEISIRFNNIGRTQAWVTGWCFNTLISSTPRVLPFEYTGINDSVGYWVAAGAGENLYTDFMVPGFTYIDEIWQGTIYFYAYGFLRYRDVFQRADEPPHETYFSRRYTRRYTFEGMHEGWMADGPEGANRNG